MPLKPKTEYIGISLELLSKLKSPLFFDIYVKRTETAFTKLFNHGDMIDLERAKTYEKRGIQSFFVREEEYGKYNLYIGKMSAKYLSTDRKITTAEKNILVKELLSVTLHELNFRQNIDQHVISNAALAVENCIKELDQDPKSLIRILKMMSGHIGIFKHSLSTSVLGVILAKADGINNATNLHHVGLGGFLHDIGHAQLSFNTEETEHLTPEQWKEMRMHPEMGKRALDSVKGIRTEVLTIVMQHHEQVNGRGYPNALKSGEIFRPAKIISIADAFSSLIADRPYRKAHSPLEAFEIMKSDVGKYDEKLLALFIQTLTGSK